MPSKPAPTPRDSREEAGPKQGTWSNDMYDETREEIEFGTVKFFKPGQGKGKGFGFVRRDNGGKDVFLHIQDHEELACSRDQIWFAERTRAEREPIKGDRVAFMSGPGDKGPRTYAWTYLDNHARLTEKIAQEKKQREEEARKHKVRLRGLPSLHRDEDIHDGDVIVHAYNGRDTATRVVWHEIVYRESTGEFFNARCSDGAGGGWQTGLPRVKAPEDVLFVM